MTPPKPLTEVKAAVPESVPLLRRAVAAFTQEIGAPEPVLASVKLAVTEAATNAVMHAYVGREAGDIEVEGWVEGEALVVTVRDHGWGMKPRLDSPGLGLGLPLIAQMADEVDVVDFADEPGTKLTMWFSLTAARETHLSVS